MANNDFFRELDTLRREIDEAFRGIGFSGPFRSRLLSPPVARRFPPVNLSEDEGNLYVELLVPGVNPADLDLSVMGNTVTVTGERKSLPENRDQVVHRSEIGSGKFCRTIELPVDIDQDRVQARYRDGRMLVQLAKAEHARPKKIEIRPS